MSTPAPDDSVKRTFIPSYSIFQEVQLLLPWSDAALESRCKQWDRHINRFTQIKCPDGSTTDCRIKYVTDHLDVLDRKFGVILQFQAVLATAGSIILTSSRYIPHTKSFYGLLFVCCAIWLTSNLLTLVGIRRIIWGDLGHPQTNADFEEVHVGAFRTEVVKRTAKFRVAMATVILTVTLLPGLLWADARGWIDCTARLLLLGGLILGLALISSKSRKIEVTPSKQNLSSGSSAAPSAPS